MDTDDDDRLERRGAEHTAKGRSDEMVGKAQRGLGKLTGNERMQTKGRLRETKGKAQHGLGRAERKADDVMDENDDTVVP